MDDKKIKELENRITDLLIKHNYVLNKYNQLKTDFITYKKRTNGEIQRLKSVISKIGRQ